MVWFGLVCFWWCQKAHLAEEEILSRATGFAADEVLRLPPRLPGQGLHRSLIDAARAQDEAARRAEAREATRHAREAAAAAAAAEEEGGGGVTSDPAGAGAGGRSRASTSGGGGKQANSRASTGGAAAASVSGNAGEGYGQLSNEDEDEDGENCNPEEGGGGEGAAAAAIAAYGDEPWLETPAEALERVGGSGGSGVPEWDRVPTAREEGRAHDVVVTGPPLSGKSTLSRVLAGRHRLPTLTVDGAVREALRLRSKLGARVRAAIHWFTAKEEVCVVHTTEIRFEGRLGFLWRNCF